MKLKDKVAIITGAAGGIGQAGATLFAGEGAKVALVDVKEDGIEATAQRVRDEGGTAIAIKADISRAEDVRRAVETTVACLGRPTVLFNNAGINAEHRLPLFEIAEEDFDRTIAVNLRGAWLMMKYVVPQMIQAGGGSIINTASISAFIAASSAGYSASKGGVVAMTRVAAVELGRYNIRVNALCPGATVTPLAAEQRVEMQARGMPAALEMVDKMSVLGRLSDPMDQARMALFLASDDAAFATGAPFIIDGGWTSISGVTPKGKN